MNKALFVCYGGGHADALIPVMKYLINNTDICVEAIGVNLAVDKLRDSGIPCKSLSNYLDIRSVEIGFKLARDRHNFSSKVSFADSIAYYGFTMSDLIDEIGEASADEVLRIFDRRTMFPVNTMMRILKLEKPDVVITTTMNRFEAATLFAAARLGIPSVKVEDLIGRINKTYPDKIQVESIEEKEKLVKNGFKEDSVILKEELNRSDAMNYCNIVYKRQLDLRPTVFAVFCDYAKQEMIKRGVPEKSIYVTGQPAFDGHPEFIIKTSRKEVAKRLGLDCNKSIVTFMSQPTADREAVLKEIAEAIKTHGLDGYQFIIKLHPNEDGKIQRYILDQYNLSNVWVIKEIDVRELLAISDLIVTVSSTTGLEAAVMAKPLVYINISEENDEIPFNKMGFGIRCTNSLEIANAIKNVLEGKISISNEVLEKYKSDACAAKRVAHIVEQLAKKEIMPIKKVAIIIQARMGSTRLPGKVMMLHAGIPQIKHVVDRMKYSKLTQDIIIATSTEKNNDSLKAYLDKENIMWYAGSENDVLKRYIEAAESISADIVVRVTADNPLTSANCIDKMIESHLQMNADYTTMNGLPIGVTAEVVNLDTLKELYMREDLTERDKEHVTIYITEHENEYKINYMEAPDELSAQNLRLTVDTEDDFERMSYIYDKLYDGKYIKIRDVIELQNSL